MTTLRNSYGTDSNVKRFGKSYGTESEKWEEHVATPVGATCMYFRCDEPIEADDDGFITPLVLASGKMSVRTMHRDCYLFSLGAIAHECDFQAGKAESCEFEWKHDKHRDPFARHV